MVNLFGGNSDIDEMYAKDLVGRLDDGRVDSNSPLKITSRCHICGDSKNNRNKKRLGIYTTTTGSVHVHCFKCDYSSGFSFYLKTYWPTMFNQYLIDVFKSKGVKRKHNRIIENDEIKIDTNYNNIEQRLPSFKYLTSLSNDHPIFKYVKYRKIPTNMYKYIGFTKTWKRLANELVSDTFKTLDWEHPRLVLPAFDYTGRLKSLHGRAFDDKQLRYQIIKTDPNINKMYGEQLINLNKNHVYVVEGPIDSLFVDNSVAIAGGSVDLNNFTVSKDKRVFILDNEPRHIDTTRRLQKMIANNESVVMWDELPSEYISCKDINDMILCGMKVKDLNNYIKNNTVVGLNATLRFDKWKKCK